LETRVFNADGRQAWPIDRGGNYHLISVEDRACNIQVDETLRADFFEPVINPRLTNPSCAGQNDGAISVTHLPTAPPYQYDWTGLNPPGLTVEDLPAGNYALRVTDALGCTSERPLTLRDPDPLTPIIITCTEVQRPPLTPSAGGGRPPYEYSIDGVNYFDRTGFERLSEGQYYTLRIRDVEGCAITQPDFFFPRATRRPARLPNFVPQEIAGSVQVIPDYFVQTISLAIDNLYGCTDSLVTFVAVDSRIPVYVPNIFTPNGDGTNDYVAIYANPLQVERVLSFQVLSRWGELMWEDYDFPPNDGRRGWDGMLNGQVGSISAYIWTAEVQLTTGELQRESGTVILMR
jgi:gliding motility-associated-like protein